ncbi:Hypothetical predicted protein [Lecanosticta acicola]|uniref:Spindle pole body-associated protein cut12 domain-containing protein n=1 Tax=Lecanosticta acicola TaxID=111012 RepID=A0AAI8Z5V6_9PEZI|nr:Hypothetical predicted protein [Lecanosticta acicola]
MLHWLAGQKGHDNNGDPDTTEYVEPPETPAPVFAVRAFKHAIFGTPQTVQQPRHPRRNSNNETTRPRATTRPRIDRPKSSNDTQTMGKLENAQEREPLPSPTKGILLTPGTAAARRKTVSFGDNVADNEDKRPMKSGLPDDCPGKFPSPWSKPTAEKDNTEDSVAKSRGRSKLTEALEQVREESAKRKSKTGKPIKSNDEGDFTTDFAEPHSESGKYWKQEYDIYRENTTREVRKLVEKRKQAKDYAREKDEENVELRKQLRQERETVERLEKRTAELEAQLKEFQSQLQKDRPAKVTAKGETDEKPARPERRSWRDGALEQPSEQIQAPATAAAVTAASQLSEANVRALDPAKDRDATKKRRTRPRDAHPKMADDFWAQGLSSLVVDSNKAEPPISTSPSRAAATRNEAGELKSRNGNTLAEGTMGVAMSMGLQPPSPQRDKRQDSPMRSPELPKPCPEPPAKTAHGKTNEPVKPSHEDSLIPAQDSSAFEPDAATERPNVLSGAPVPIKSTLRPWSRPVDTKENVSPNLRPGQPGSLENTKPSETWNAMSAPAEQRTVSLTNGKEMDAARNERARARLAAKGRQVS